MEATIIAGFTLGIISSWHCVGMCGPIAIALPVYHQPKWQQLVSNINYQFGRIITYAVLGLLSGLAGRQFFLAGWQQWFTIIMGSLILLSLLLYKGHHYFKFPFLNKYYSFIQKLIGIALKGNRTPLSFLLLGMANGLLPCGLVYLALAGALSTADVKDSMLFMAMFGAGTAPAMILATFYGQKLSLSIRQGMKKAVPFFVAGMAVILILRGLNLGIPFISPHLPAASATAVSCHG